jgi:hypothetical protein
VLRSRPLPSMAEAAAAGEMEQVEVDTPTATPPDSPAPLDADEQLSPSGSAPPPLELLEATSDDAPPELPAAVPRTGPMGTPRMTPIAVRKSATSRDGTGDKAGAGSDDEMSEAEKTHAGNWLFASNLLQTFGMMISMQSTNQIWLDHFAGDFGAHARVMTRLSSVSNVIGFIIKPMLASSTDKFGRKPLLSLSPVLQFILKGAMVLCPTRWLVSLLSLQYMSSAFTYETGRIATDAAHGDMYAKQPKMLSKMISRQMLTYPITSIICPLIGGSLARIHLRLPLAVTALVSLASALFIVPRVPETLPASRRTARISLAGASPLSAVKLFTQGRRLRGLACFQIVNNVSSGMNTHQIQEIHQMQVCEKRKPPLAGTRLALRVRRAACAARGGCALALVIQHLPPSPS